MDEEALKDAYKLFVTTGYDGDINKFKNLISTDNEALSDAHKLFVSTGYDGDINKFKNLLGVGVKKKEQTTGLPSTDGSLGSAKKPTWELTKPSEIIANTPNSPVKPVNQSITSKGIEVSEPLYKGENNVSNQSDATVVEKQFAPKPFDENAPTRSSNKDLEQTIANITPDYLQHKEEFIVPDLKYQLSGHGFKVEESGLGDNISVTAPNGKTIDIKAYGSIEEVRKTEAKKLQDFIKVNKRNETFQKSIDEQDAYNKKFLDQKEVDASFAKLSQEQQSFDANKKAVSLLPKDSPEYNAKLKELETQFNQLGKHKKQLDVNVGKYVTMKGEQGTFMGGLYNAALGGVGEIASGIVSSVIDGQNLFPDVTKQALKKELLPKTREILTETIGDKNTTKEWETEAGFINGAILGLAKSAPSMLGGAATLPLMYLQISDNVEEEMQNNPEFENVSETEKLLMKNVLGVAGAALEKAGFDFVVHKTGILNSVVLKALGKATGDVTATTFEQLVKDEVKSELAQGVLTLTADGLVEFGTESAQEFTDIGIKYIYNKIKDKDMFKTPETFGQGVKQILVAGGQGFVGGAILGGVSSVGSAYAKKNYSDLEDRDIDIMKSMGNDATIGQSLETDLQMKVNQGEITPEVAAEQVDNFRQAVGVMNSIDTEGLSNEQIKEALPIAEKIKKLELSKEGKLPIVKKVIQAEIDELNDKLSKATGNENILEPTKKENDATKITTAKKVDVGNTPENGGTMGEGNAKEQTTPETSTKEEVTPVRVNGVNAIDNKGNVSKEFSDKIELLKENKDKEGLNEIYSTIKILLNGVAQSKGENTVKALETIKSDLEDFAKEEERPKEEVKPIINKADGNKTKNQTKAKTIETKRETDVLIEEPSAAVEKSAAEEVKKEVVEYNGVDYEVTHNNGKVEKITKVDTKGGKPFLISDENLVKGIKESFELEYTPAEPQVQKPIVAETKTTANTDNLIRKVQSYNALSKYQKGTKNGLLIQRQISESAGKLGLDINIPNLKTGNIKLSKEGKQVKHTAMTEDVAEPTAEAVTFAKQMIKQGAVDQWLDIGLQPAEIKKGVEGIRLGKMTKPAKILINALNERQSDNGLLYTEKGIDGSKQSVFVSFDEIYDNYQNNKKEYSPEEEKALAEQYDAYLSTLTEAEQNHIENLFNDEKQIDTKSESESDGINQDGGTKEPTAKEKAKQRVEKAKEAFIKKGKDLQLGGLETLPEFTELVLSYINLAYETGKEATVKYIFDKFRTELEGFDFDEKIAAEKINAIFKKQGINVEEKKESSKSNVSDKFNELAHKNIESDEIRNTLNNVERETGRVLTKEESEYKSTARLDAIQHGANVVEAAKEEFGETYVSDLLNYLKDNSKTIGVANQSLITISLELDLERQIKENPPNVLTLEKQLKLVRDISIKQQRSAAIATGYGILRQIARVGYDLSEVTNELFTTNELNDKKDITKAIESNIDDINNEAVELEKGNMPYDIDYLIQKGVDKEINGIYELLPPIKKSYAKSALKALENVQKTLRSKTYDATIGIPVQIIDSGIEVIKQSIKLGYTITQAVDAGISAIKKLLKGEKWAKESEFRKDAIESFTKFMPKTGSIVKEALIKAGYGRTMNIKGAERNILDWKKLAGEEGSIENIKIKVEEVLKSEGKSKSEIDAMAQELMDEYNSIRESIIQKAQNELARRNKTTVSGKQRTAAQKLAELYNFGLFEKNVEEYETAIIKAIGAKVSDEGFKQAKKIAKAMETVYTSSFNGIKLNDISAKTQLEYLDNQLRILLFRESRKHGTTAYKATQIARNYMDIQQTMILNSFKQALENPWSGFSQDIIDKINIMTKNNDVKGLSELRTKLRRSIFKDMTLKGGIGYGKMENQFTNRQHLDDLINKLSTNELYQFSASIATGKTILNAADALFKASITEKKFISNLIQLMTDPTNPSRMSKDDAKQYIAENMLGQTYHDAIKTATELSEKINKDAGIELVPENKFAIQRFANDIIKSSLEMGGKVTKEQILAAYNAAYNSAGLNLGHESNNFLSGMIKGYSAKLEDRINKAIKEKEWRQASWLTLESMIFRNFMTPFVGGGTNWLVLNFDKTGAGLITGLYKQSKIPLGRIDISTKDGLAKMQERMVLQASAKDSFYRGLTGLVVSLLAYAAIKGLDDEDKYKKWRKENHNLAKYLDLFTPTLVLANFALNDGKVFEFLSNLLNQHDAFSSTTKSLKASKYAFGKEPNPEKAYGALGEAIGQKLNTPLPWRLVRDGNELYKGVTGKDPYRGDYSPSIGFMSGVLQGGVIEYTGYRPIKEQFPDPSPSLHKRDPKAWEERFGENSDWYKMKVERFGKKSEWYKRNEENKKRREEIKAKKEE